MIYTSLDLACLIEMKLDIFSKPAAVVVQRRACIPESFQQRVDLQFMNCQFVSHVRHDSERIVNLSIMTLMTVKGVYI